MRSLILPSIIVSINFVFFSSFSQAQTNSDFYGNYSYGVTVASCENSTGGMIIGNDSNRKAEENYLYISSSESSISYSFIDDDDDLINRTITIADDTITVDDVFDYPGASSTIHYVLGFSNNYSNFSISGFVTAEDPSDCGGTLSGSGTRVVIEEDNSEKLFNPDNGHYYQRIATGMPWKKAKTYCEQLGGYLATINSEDENTFVYDNLVKTSSHFCWIGGTDEIEEGIWKWITGETWSYSNWNSGEPNNECNNEDYAHMYHLFNRIGETGGTWNDQNNDGNCGISIGFTGDFFAVCEWDSDDGDVGAMPWIPLLLLDD